MNSLRDFQAVGEIRGRKLYLISYYFAPLGRADGVNRALLVRELSRRGWDIEVLSCSNPHAFGRSFQRDDTLLDLIPQSVRLHAVESRYWGPLGQLAYMTGLARDPFLNWKANALAHGLGEFRQPGIIYAVVPPIVNLLIASEIASERGWPLVVDFRDNVEHVPSAALAPAKAFLASTSISLEDMRSRYSMNVPGMVFYNGCPSLPEFSSPTPVPVEGTTTILYAGLLNQSQDPVVLLKTLSDLKDFRPDLADLINVDFIGPRNFYTEMILRPRLLRNCRFLGYLPYREAWARMASAQICFTSLAYSNKRYCIPSKVFQYISAGSPILAFGQPGGALQEFIESWEMGLFADYADRESCVSALGRLAEDMTLRESIKDKTRIAAEHFSLSLQAERLHAFLRDLDAS